MLYRIQMAVIPISGRFVPTWEEMVDKGNSLSTRRLFKWACKWKIIKRKQPNILCKAESGLFGMPIEKYLAVL